MCTEIESKLSRLVEQEGQVSWESFCYHAELVTPRRYISGKRILELGCGLGHLALWWAVNGAEAVIALDEAAGHGAPVGVTNNLPEHIRELSLDNITRVIADALEFEFGNGKWDIVIARNSLHHILPTTDDTCYLTITKQRILGFLARIRDALVQGGTLILQERMRRNLSEFYLPLGLPDPFKQQVVNKTYHRNPGYFAGLAEQAGFAKVIVRYPVSYRLRHLQAVLSNRLGSFLTHSGYILKAMK